MLKHSNGTKDGLVSNKPFNMSNDTHLLMKEAGLSTQRGARELRSELHGLPHTGGDSRYGGKRRRQAKAKERKHWALRPQKPSRLIRDGEVGGSGILYLTPTRYTVTTIMILH